MRLLRGVFLVAFVSFCVADESLGSELADTEGSSSSSSSQEVTVSAPASPCPIGVICGDPVVTESEVEKMISKNDRRVVRRAVRKASRRLRRGFDRRIVALKDRIAKIKQLRAIPGPPGPRGNPGPIGPIGKRGRRGRTGRRGEAGDPGPPGKLGPRGQPGDNGRPGDDGKQGPVGPVGPKGATGPAGPSGRTGGTGRTGAPGPRGAPGAQGRRGPPGARGATGATGRRGPRGPVGVGRTGRRGKTGRTGPTGRRGPRGSPGKGSRGRPGPRGQTGARGKRGATGRPGRTGKTGKRGARGPRGSKGARGSSGRKGKTGSRGPPGKTGSRGSSGKQGKAGPRGPRGAPGVIPKSILQKIKDAAGCKPKKSLQKTWKIAITTAGYSWKDSKTACEGSGLSLCSYKDLCRCGDKTKKATIGRLAGDKWVPVGGDGENQWLQLGAARKKWYCKLHDDIEGGKYGRPAWGTRRNRGTHHGPLFCCGPKKFTAKKKDVVRLAAGYGWSWNDANRGCQSNGMRLCKYSQLCPKGPGAPTVVGVLRGNAGHDAWVPYGGEMAGAYVQMGKYWKTCYRHSDIKGGRYGATPGWGAQRHRGSWKRYVFCCGKPKINTLRVEVAKSTASMTWSDAKGVCRGNGLDLCNYFSVCPKGKGQTPYGGRRPGDDWGPIGGEGSNMWVQYGKRWPQCYRHTEIPGGMRYGPWGRPSWGRNRSRYHFKGTLYCCGNSQIKKLVRKTPVSVGTSKGKSWTEAYNLCKSKSKSLCRFVDICQKGPLHPPVFGTKTNRDVWIPLGGEGQNRWLQVGNKPWPVCLRHSEIGSGRHGHPGWGNGRSSASYKGNIYCC